MSLGGNGSMADLLVYRRRAKSAREFMAYDTCLNTIGWSVIACHSIARENRPPVYGNRG